MRYFATALVFVSVIGGSVSAQDKNDAVEKNIVPYVTKHCVQCHGPKKKNASLALHIYTDEKSILKDRKRWIEVIRMLSSGEMPPEKQPRPDINDTDKFLKTIRSIFANADAKGPLDPGRVTMRRLNRAEYNNTIRDLIGVDFKPAEDFPADDVGHGFDNIGDVLTVSPVLMERYLAAAETITQQAIVVGDMPAPPKRRTSGQFLNSQQSQVIRDTAMRRLDVAGEFSTTHKIRDAGIYKMRIRAWAQHAGPEAVKVSFRVNNKEFGTAEIKALSKANAETTIAQLNSSRAITLVWLFESFTDPRAKMSDEAKRTLFVQYFEFEGPPTRAPSAQKIMAHKEGLSHVTACPRYSNACTKIRRRKRKSIVAHARP